MASRGSLRKMRAMNSCLVFALIASSAIALNPSDPKNPQEAVARLQQAVSRTNIFELPSFVMKAKVQIELKGKMVDGTYQLLWNGEDQWREEILLPEYAEIQVGGKGMLWVKRNTNFIPLRIYNIHEALGFGSGVAGAGALHAPKSRTNKNLPLKSASVTVPARWSAERHIWTKIYSPQARSYFPALSAFWITARPSPRSW